MDIFYYCGGTLLLSLSQYSMNMTDKILDSCTGPIMLAVNPLIIGIKVLYMEHYATRI